MVFAAVAGFFHDNALAAQEVTPSKPQTIAIDQEQSGEDARSGEAVLAGEPLGTDVSAETPPAATELKPTRTESRSIGAAILRAFLGRAEETSPSEKANATSAEVTTHRQSAIFQVSDEKHPELEVHTFCLDNAGRLLAGCGESPGAIRVLNADGTIIDQWEVPIKPEAIHVGHDGLVYLAGDGRLLRLTASGEVLKNVEAPHLAAIEANTDKIREQLVEQQKLAAQSYVRMREQMEKQATDIKEQLSADNTDQDDTDQEKANAASTTALKRRLPLVEARVDAYRKMEEQVGGAELSEAEVAQRVDAMKRSKMRVASISTTPNGIFVACGSQEGYGYDVWRMNNEFETGKVVVTGLRGCCGQMDVKANTNGIYVAENSRHRVCCFDVDGAEICTWGKSDRDGTLTDGFASCCNPMNVAFGPDDTVYTAESTTGRIKRFNAAGKYLDTVGQVDLVPGCKNVSIAANQDGSRVYMLDITRKHLVVMDRSPDAQAANTPAEGTDASETR